MITLNKNVKNAFKLEKLRDLYAVRNNLKKFKLLYKPTNPEIVNGNTSSLWDDKNVKSVYTSDSNPMGNDRINKAVSFVNINNIKILDIGFGPADFEKRLIKKDTQKIIQLDGIDISKQSVLNATKEIPRWTFKIGSIINYKFSSKIKYNYVIMLEVLEHISPKNTFSVLKKIYNILDNRGKLILSIPLNESLYEMVKNGTNPNAHVRVYTKNIVEAELKLSGFEILKTKCLFAFHKYYHVKSMLNEMVAFNSNPNNILIFAQKI